MSIRAQLTLFGGWSKDPCLRIFIRRVLGIQPCSMARFGRMFALGSGDGKTVPTKTCPSSLHRLSRTLSAEKKRVPLRFFTFPVKSTRALFKENCTFRETQKHCDLWYKINVEHCKRWKRGFDKQPAGMFWLWSLPHCCCCCRQSCLFWQLIWQLLQSYFLLFLLFFVRDDGCCWVFVFSFLFCLWYFYLVFLFWLFSFCFSHSLCSSSSSSLCSSCYLCYSCPLCSSVSSCCVYLSGSLYYIIVYYYQ